MDSIPNALYSELRVNLKEWSREMVLHPVFRVLN